MLHLAQVVSQMPVKWLLACILHTALGILALSECGISAPTRLETDSGCHAGIGKVVLVYTATLSSN